MAQKNVVAPRLPSPPQEYDPVYMNQLLSLLRLYFNQLDNAGPMAGSTQINGTTVVSGLSFFPTSGTDPSLPTDADFANLRIGDVYRDTTTGATSTSQVLRIKTAV
jgi:hypothetical protein